MDQEAIISVKDLRTYFYSDKRCNKVLNGISFELYKGRTLCVVGESGCGKSVTASCIMQLLPTLSRIESGSITYHGPDGDVRIDQLERNGKPMRSLRGAELAMIFQDPMTALNPVYTIGFQIKEDLQYHTKMDKKARHARTLELLGQMGISNPEKRVDQYPHEFSGGMRQRAMIAMAMSCNPKVLIADEPTTALDVTIQREVLDLIAQLVAEDGMALLLISHDLGVMAENVQRLLVMYGGTVVEEGPTAQVFQHRAHPYTRGLFAARPQLGLRAAARAAAVAQGGAQVGAQVAGRRHRLTTIPGRVPELIDLPVGCGFAERCSLALDACRAAPPPALPVAPDHLARCLRLAEAQKLP